MKIEVWSDYVCPFCYIGKRRLEQALEQFEHKEEIDIVFKSFELDPQADSNSNLSTYSMLAKKYNMSVEQAKANSAGLTEQAAKVGITFNMDGTVETNTFDSHRIMQYAAEQGKEKELSERLFKANFTDNIHVGKKENLIQLAVEVGLDGEAVADVLASEKYADAVRAEEEEGSRLGIRGVPFFVINRKYAISGAQPEEVFVEAITKAWNEQ